MSSLRPAALIAGAALALHELRYALAGGGSAESLGGHGYVPLAGLAAGIMLALACGHLLARILGAGRSGRGEPGGTGLTQAWGLAAASLLAIFTAQELLEGLLATGRASSLGAVAGAGGWTALPLAIALGGLIAAALTAACAAVAAAARRASRSERPRGRPPRRRALEAPVLARPPVLAAHSAGRAPPLAS